MSLAIGEVAPAFSLPATDGKTYSFAALAGDKATVIMFWCNHCPYVKPNQARMIAMQAEYAERGVRFAAICANDAAAYPERFPEQFDTVGEDVQLLKEYLGETVTWLEERVSNRLVKIRYKGKDASTYASDDEACEFLYGEGLEFTTDYEIDEEAAMKLRSGEGVREVFHKRAVEEARRIR